MSEVPTGRIIEIETIDNLKMILGCQVVDDMISDPDEWDHSIFFSDGRFTEIENKKQIIARERIVIYNRFSSKEISKEELTRKDTQNLAEDKELEKTPNYEYWTAVNHLIGVRASLKIFGYKIQTSS